MIPAGTYPGIDAETPSVGFNALWIVSADASDDLIYAITKALWNEATQRLLEAHNPIGKQVRLEDALDGSDRTAASGGEAVLSRGRAARRG